MKENRSSLIKTLLTTREAAEFLRVKPQTLRTRRHKNMPPKFIKAQGKQPKILYDLEDLKEYLGIKEQDNG